jgi:hypothetical protein
MSCHPLSRRVCSFSQNGAAIIKTGKSDEVVRETGRVRKHKPKTTNSGIVSNDVLVHQHNSLLSY